MSDIYNGHPFQIGFDFALARWRAGETIESISHYADASIKGRGIYAACEALVGWHDTAERECRMACGVSREQAYVFVRDRISREP